MSGPFSAAPHHDVLVLLVQIAVLLITARVLGELATRLKQPSVVGEILAGVLLGPSLLSGFFPALGAWVVPSTPLSGYLLEVVSLLGAMFLLFVTGLEMDLGLVKRHARTAVSVSLGGILTTFTTGFALGWLLPPDLRGPVASQLVFALFVATAMSISAIPVIAKVLMDLGLMRRDIGQTIIAAGISDDTIGWILLSIVAGLAAGESVTAMSVSTTVFTVACFMGGSLLIGRPLVERLVGWVQDHGQSQNRILTLAVAAMFVWAALTQALHLEAVLGAFVMGVLFGQVRRVPVEVVERIEGMTLAIFAPIFFAVAGLKVDVRALLEPRLLAVGAVVIAVASLGKVVGTYAGARVFGRRPHWTALAYGAGLNARGAMEILIASIGLRLGILSSEMFSVVVVMAIATSLMAPPAMRFVVRRLEVDPAEQRRLEREAAEQNARLGGLTRALLPMRPRTGVAATQSLEAWVLERLGASMALTLYTVSSSATRAGAQEFLAGARRLFSHREVSLKVSDGEPTARILEEAGRDYDLVVMGAPEVQPEGDAVFNPVIDLVMRNAPCTTLVIRGGQAAGHFPPRRILVPCNGSAAGRLGAELACRVAEGSAVEVVAIHVDTFSGEVVPGERRSFRARAREGVAESLESVRELGAMLGVDVATLQRAGASVTDELLSYAREQQFDLIVLGTDVKVGTSRLYLGPRVERLLREAPCPVVLING